MFRRASWSIALLAAGCGGDGATAFFYALGDPVAGRPQGYSNPSVSFDEARGVLVVAGGGSARADGSLTLHGKTWEGDGASWTEATGEGPTPRYRAAMAYDAAREKTVLFGGFGSCAPDGGLDCCGDTWEWDGAVWIEAMPAKSPTPRGLATLNYDPKTARTLLFGGYACDGAPARDLWAWDGASWEQLWP